MNPTNKQNLKTFFNNPVFILILCYFVVSVIKIYITSSILHPQSLPDEYFYDLVGRMFLDGSLFMGSNPYLSQYPPFYSIIISIGHIVSENTNTAYHVNLMWNCLISSLIVFPAYAILKRFTSEFYSLAGAILVLVLPAITTSNLLLMSENLFTPLFVLVLWVFIRSLDYEKQSIYDILVGIIIFLAFFTRTTGISLVLGYILAMSVVAYINHGYGRELLILKKMASGIVSMIMLYSIWCIDQLLTKGVIPKGYVIPLDQIFSLIINKPTLFIHTILLEIQYLIIASFAVFFVFTIYWTYNSPNNTLVKMKPEAIISGTSKGIVVFVITSSFFLFLIGIIFIFGMIQNQIPYVYGRYVDPITPLLIIFGTIGIFLFSENGGKMKPRNWYYFMGLLILLFLGLLISIQTLPEPNNNTSIFYLYTINSTFSWIIAAIIPVIFMGWFILTGNTDFGRKSFFVLCIFLAIIASIPIITWLVSASNGYGSILQWNNALEKKVLDDDIIIWESTQNDIPDSVIYSGLKFWMQDRLIQANLDIKKQKDGTILIASDQIFSGQWLITKKEYPLKNSMIYKPFTEPYNMYILKDN